MLRIAESGLLVCRLFMAAVFLLAGATKLFDPIGFRRALRNFGLPSPIARSVVLLLPLIEFAVAAALLSAHLAWYGARGALALLTAFSVAVVVVIIRGRKVDCHCFGQLGSSAVGWPTLIRNAVFAACAGWLASRGAGPAGPDLWAWFSALGTNGRKAVILAACLAVFVFFRLLDRARPRAQSIGSQMSRDEDETPREQSAPEPGKRTTNHPAARPRRIAGIGHPIGTPAPEFELQAVTGERSSLQSLRKHGKDVLLVFSNPHCKPCQTLASELVRWTRAERLPTIVLVSRGAPQENLTTTKEFEPSRTLLQKDFEIAEVYGCDATPAAVLVGEDGLIRSELAMGTIAIRELLSSSAARNIPPKTILARSPDIQVADDRRV